MATRTVLSLSLLYALLYFQADALTCDDESLKITIKTPKDQYEFDEYEQYELKATIAYSIQKYCGEVEGSPCDGNITIVAENITLFDITERISMCTYVTNFTPDQVRAAIRISKANLNGALILTDDTLFVAGIEPTLSPVPELDFPPWIIVYIVVFGLIIIGGITVVLYTRFHSSQKDSEDEEKSMIDEEQGAETRGGQDNQVYEDSEDPTVREEQATAL